MNVTGNNWKKAFRLQINISADTYFILLFSVRHRNHLGLEKLFYEIENILTLTHYCS